MTQQRGGKGNFARDPERAAEAGRKGGQVSGGNFKNDPERAAEAGRKEVSAYGVIDWNTKYKFKPDTFAYFQVDNVMDNEYIVSYRPVGARPGKARTFFLGFRQSF